MIDWDHYAPDVHLPSVVEHSRVRTTPGGRTGEKREDRLRRQVLDPARHFAAFDLENTLIASNVVASYSWLATRRLPPEDRVRFVLQTLREAPALLAADRRDRSDFLRHFYRRYDGADVDAARSGRRRDVQRPHPHEVVPGRGPPGARAPRPRPPHGAHHRRARPRHRAAAAAVRRHRRPRRSPVAPTAPTAASSPTCRPPARPGPRRCSTTPTPTGFDVAEGVAYADSTSDLPMLEAVGFPVAVNPETRLAALARKRGWLVEHFDKAKGAPQPLLPDRPGVGPPAPPARRQGRHRGARRDEGARVLAQAGQVRGRHGGGPARARRRRQGRAPLAARRRPARPARARVGAAAAPAVGHLRLRPGHHRRHVVALVRADRVVPVHPRPRGGGRPRRRRSAPSSCRCSAAWPAASARCACRAPTGASTTASASASATSSPGLQCGFCESTGGGWSTADGRPREPARRRCPPTCPTRPP